jgi:hypothetical protein
MENVKDILARYQYLLTVQYLEEKMLQVIFVIVETILKEKWVICC